MLPSVHTAMQAIGLTAAAGAFSWVALHRGDVARAKRTMHAASDLIEPAQEMNQRATVIEGHQQHNAHENLTEVTRLVGESRASSQQVLMVAIEGLAYISELSARSRQAMRLAKRSVTSNQEYLRRHPEVLVTMGNGVVCQNGRCWRENQPAQWWPMGSPGYQQRIAPDLSISNATSGRPAP